MNGTCDRGVFRLGGHGLGHDVSVLSVPNAPLASVPEWGACRYGGKVLRSLGHRWNAGKVRREALPHAACQGCSARAPDQHGIFSDVTAPRARAWRRRLGGERTGRLDVRALDNPVCQLPNLKTRRPIRRRMNRSSAMARTW